MTTASVCVPVYNGARYVAARVSSILTQTHQDLQIVVVDNASTDGTRAVLAPFLADSRVTRLTSDKTIPAADNWNRAGRRRGFPAGRMGGVATPAEDARV